MIASVGLLREAYNFHDKYDLVLASSLEYKEERNSKLLFYESIEGVVDSLEKKIFLPHKDIDLENWSDERIHDIATGIVVPSSDLVVCYAGTSSNGKRVMLESACSNRKPVIFLCEYGKEEGIRSICNNHNTPEVVDVIMFRKRIEALIKLKNSIHYFYNKQFF